MEGREVVSLGGVGHGELSQGFFGLTMVRGFVPYMSNMSAKPF